MPADHDAEATAPLPDRVQTPSELATALMHLRGARSYSELDRSVRPGHLARSTLSDMLTGRTVPTRDTLLLFLTGCGLDDQARHPWLAAWERVCTAGLTRPPAAVRVGHADPRLLGVHASIQVDAAATGLPAYVPRDLDLELRTHLTVARDQGSGYVLLVGGSSVGKTRALYEQVRTVLTEWWLVHPDPPTRPH